MHDIRFALTILFLLAITGTSACGTEVASPDSETSIAQTEVGTDFWANSYFAVQSPYRQQGWLNPSKEKYIYAWPKGVIQTKESGYLMVGPILTGKLDNEQDGLIIKLNAKGEVEKGFALVGGYSGWDDRQSNALSAVIQAQDGNYIVAGVSHRMTFANKIAGDSNMWVTKLSTQGKILWTKAYGMHPYTAPMDSSGQSDLYGTAIFPTADGGYLLGGSKLIKIDSQGNVQWSRNIAGHVSASADGGFVMLTGDDQKGIGGITKITSDGKHLWSKEYAVAGLMTTFVDMTTTVDESGKDTGYLIAGILRYNENRSSDWLVLSVDLNGNILWKKALGGGVYDPAHLKFSEEWPTAVIKTADGNYLISGISESFNETLNFNNIILVKMKADGTILTQKSFEGSHSKMSTLIPTSKGFAFTGDINGRALLVSCDQNGDVASQSSEPYPFFKNIEMQVLYPQMNEADVTASTVFTDFFPAVTNMKTTTYELKIDQVKY